MKVKFFAYLRNYTGAKEIEIADENCSSVRCLILYLCKSYGSSLCSFLMNGNELSSEIIVLVNGRNIVHLQGLDTPLGNGDEVSIFPVVAGG